MPGKDLQDLVRDYMDAALAYAPAGATARGFHQHDHRLEDRSREAIDGRRRTLQKQLDRAVAIDASRLSPSERADRELIERRLRWELTDIDEVQSWRRNPGGYLGTIGASLNGLVIRDFAPLKERAKVLVSRLRETPRLLDQAKANVEEPSRIHVETAIEQGMGLRSLFLRDLPDALSGLDDNVLLGEFEAASTDALGAVEAYVAWMKDDLLPRATDEFAWGADRIGKLLRYVDFVDRPLEELVKRGREDLRAHQERLRDVASRIKPGASPAEVVDEVSRDHPVPEGLLPDTEALLEDLRQFSIDARLCTIPTEVRIQVKETPGFSRATVQAACSPPGAWEKNATEAYYYVTPPDPAWPPERTEAYLKFFNRHSMPGITAHEAYPGHYVHLTYLWNAASDAGKFLLTTTAIEGWAHYVEQLMIEAGYGDGDPRLEIMQIREALLRLCRYLAAFGMHTQGWTFEQTVRFFIDEGYATPLIAERETRRGVIGPVYYAYTLGKHEILDLREKFRRKAGAAYDQRTFHDHLMQLPYPVQVIEGMLLA